jgi:hypothetical protein
MSAGDTGMGMMLSRRRISVRLGLGSQGAAGIRITEIQNPVTQVLSPCAESNS